VLTTKYATKDRVVLPLSDLFLVSTSANKLLKSTIPKKIS